MSFSSIRYLILFLLLAACVAPAPEVSTQPDAPTTLASPAAETDHDHVAEASHLSRFTPVALAENEKLHVVATTNLIADVTGRIGGDHIELYTMLPVGADPHSYQPTPQDLRMLTDADVIFINGLGLEEAMALALEDFAAKSVVVNIGVETIQFGHQDHGADSDEEQHEEEADHAHEGADPHTWFSVHAVEQWAQNIVQVLSDLDPANADIYGEAAAVYVEELEALHVELEAQVAQIPVDQRKLVTDHDSLGYLAKEYGFEIIGSVIPSTSTLAEPSAQQLAALQDQIMSEGARAIFVSTTINPQLETQLAQDTGIAVVPVYTGSLSEPGGPAANYLDFMRYNIGVIVEALR